MLCLQVIPLPPSGKTTKPIIYLFREELAMHTCLQRLQQDIHGRQQEKLYEEQP